MSCGSAKLEALLPRALDLPAREAEHPRGGVRGLGARGRVGREQLEVVLAGRVVRPELETPCDDLVAEPGGRLEAGRAGAEVEAVGRVGEAERAHEAGVQPVIVAGADAFRGRRRRHLLTAEAGTREARSPRVRGSFARNVFTLRAIRPWATTTLICGSAQVDAPPAAQAGAASSARARR